MTSFRANPFTARLFPVILFGLWELPQNLLGLLLFVFVVLRNEERKSESRGNRVLIRCGKMVSLGSFVFWSDPRGEEASAIGGANREHEYGHALQSRLLGPFFLPLVGLPSVARLAFAGLYRRVTGRRWPDYYRGYPEQWADRLGGVKRA